VAIITIEPPLDFFHMEYRLAALCQRINIHSAAPVIEISSRLCQGQNCPGTSAIEQNINSAEFLEFSPELNVVRVCDIGHYASATAVPGQGDFLLSASTAGVLAANTTAAAPSLAASGWFLAKPGPMPETV
jgi:hypothetical protein